LAADIARTLPERGIDALRPAVKRAGEDPAILKAVDLALDRLAKSTEGIASDILTDAAQWFHDQANIVDNRRRGANDEVAVNARDQSGVTSSMLRAIGRAREQELGSLLRGQAPAAPRSSSAATAASGAPQSPVRVRPGGSYDLSDRVITTTLEGYEAEEPLGAARATAARAPSETEQRSATPSARAAGAGGAGPQVRGGLRKLPTFAQARKALLAGLRSRGWQLKEDLKEPHAWNGDRHLWFTPQAIYAGASTSRKEAHSLSSDLRSFPDADALLAAVERWFAAATATSPSGAAPTEPVEPALRPVTVARKPPTRVEGLPQAEQAAAVLVEHRTEALSQKLDGKAPCATEEGVLAATGGEYRTVEQVSALLGGCDPDAVRKVLTGLEAKFKLRKTHAPPDRWGHDIPPHLEDWGVRREGDRLYADTAFLTAAGKVPDFEVRHIGWGNLRSSPPKGRSPSTAPRGRTSRGSPDARICCTATPRRLRS
jgi:hypothetical protein